MVTLVCYCMLRGYPGLGRRIFAIEMTRLIVGLIIGVGFM